jgi:hypothetical protein
MLSIKVGMQRTKQHNVGNSAHSSAWGVVQSPTEGLNDEADE